MSCTGIPHPSIQVKYFPNNQLIYLEPVGGSSPKFSGSSILSSFVGKTSHPQTLTCPAQGSPVPAFRCPHNRICFQRASGRVSSQTDWGVSCACLHGRLSHSTHCPALSCTRGSCPRQVLRPTSDGKWGGLTMV